MKISIGVVCNTSFLASPLRNLNVGGDGASVTRILDDSPGYEAVNSAN